MKQEISPKTILIVAIVLVVVVGAALFFATGGRLGGEPTQESLGIGGDVKPGELPEGVKYHDLGGSAGPGSSSTPTQGSPAGPGR